MNVEGNLFHYIVVVVIVVVVVVVYVRNWNRMVRVKLYCVLSFLLMFNFIKSTHKKRQGSLIHL